MLRSREQCYPVAAFLRWINAQAFLRCINAKGAPMPRRGEIGPGAIPFGGGPTNALAWWLPKHTDAPVVPPKQYTHARTHTHAHARTRTHQLPRALAAATRSTPAAVNTWACRGAHGGMEPRLPRPRPRPHQHLGVRLRGVRLRGCAGRHPGAPALRLVLRCLGDTRGVACLGATAVLCARCYARFHAARQPHPVAPPEDLQEGSLRTRRRRRGEEQVARAARALQRAGRAACLVAVPCLAMVPGRAGAAQALAPTWHQPVACSNLARAGGTDLPVAPTLCAPAPLPRRHGAAPGRGAGGSVLATQSPCLRPPRVLCTHLVRCLSCLLCPHRTLPCMRQRGVQAVLSHVCPRRIRQAARCASLAGTRAARGSIACAARRVLVRCPCSRHRLHAVSACSVVLAARTACLFLCVPAHRQHCTPGPTPPESGSGQDEGGSMRSLVAWSWQSWQAAAGWSRRTLTRKTGVSWASSSDVRALDLEPRGGGFVRLSDLWRRHSSLWTPTALC